MFGNRLNFKSKVLCIDAPYFDAPGTLEAPLGMEEEKNRHLNRQESDDTDATASMVSFDGLSDHPRCVITVRMSFIYSHGVAVKNPVQQV